MLMDMLFGINCWTCKYTVVTSVRQIRGHVREIDKREKQRHRLAICRRRCGSVIRKIVEHAAVEWVLPDIREIHRGAE